jgi:predicted ester cyclase
MKHFVASLRTAFPDLEVTVDDQMTTGDTVVTRWTARGTHTGPFQGIPATSRRGTMAGIDIDRIANGKTVECWSSGDYLGLMQQLGIVPIADQAPTG